jgi:hypothetical protein
MKLTRALAFTTASLLSAGVQAQLLTNPAALPDQGEVAYGVWLGNSSTTYKLDKTGETGDIGRTGLAVSAEYGAHDLVTVYGSAAYAFDVEDGNGHQLELGLKGPLKFIQLGSVGFNWYSALSIYDESLGANEETNVSDIDNVLSEWLLGAVAVKSINDNFSIYGGLEAVAYSLGEADYRSEFNDAYKSDFERDAKIGVKGGVIWNDIELHAGIGHEASVLVGVRLPLGGYDYSLGSRASTPTAPAPVKTVAPAEATEQPKEITFDPYANQEKAKPKLNARETLRLVQQKLNFRGYNAGPADGLMGKRTRSALMAYQKDRNLPQTGKPDDATLTALGM